METNENHALTKAEGCYHCKPLVQQRNELAAKVERLRGASAEIAWSWREDHGENDGVYQDLMDALSETPPAALAALKAQWQADAVREVAADIRGMTAHHTQYSVSLMACRVDGMADSIERIEEVRQRPQEYANAKASQQQT